MTSQKFSIRKLEAFCYRYPLSTPVVTSFGRMLDRPAVFVRVEDDDGLTGWGEVWANFPSIGAEHRARLVNEVLAPAISGFTAGQPADVFEKLTRATAVLALQSGEPGLVRADRPWEEWQALREAVDVPLAAGENIASRAGFQQALGDDVLRVIQPDIAKWGGLSVCLEIARDILESDKMFCPHYLGGGIGLLASAHLLAGVGGDGLLEVDSNDNPLRDRFCGPVINISDGLVTLEDDPGLGIEPDLSSIETYRTA